MRDEVSTEAALAAEQQALTLHARLVELNRCLRTHGCLLNHEALRALILFARAGAESLRTGRRIRLVPQARRSAVVALAALLWMARPPLDRS
jgi:hypothetical protein